jgi:beta-N-acetylhexosaminidase
MLNSLQRLLPSLSLHKCQESNESALLKKMTLEEKVGQLFMAHFRGETANVDAKALVQDVKVGGVIYYNWANGLSSPEQVKKLSASLQALSLQNQHPIPLLIAVDQEGGIVARLNQGFTIFPGNKALGMTKDPKLAEKAAFAMGQEMQSVGVNMNLARVVDINSEPRNPVIGIRSFGDSPNLVLDFGAKALNGYKSAHVITSLKHFPGHGDVLVDSHSDLPVNPKSLKELEQSEIAPFAQLGASADTIMTAHILVPAMDPKNCATLSPKILSYLRNKIGFQGPIVADSLTMDGVLKQCKTVNEAAIRAINAGCDILIFGGKKLTGQADQELSVAEVQCIHRSIVDAVKSGRVAEDRLNQAVTKILILKEKHLNSNAAIQPPGGILTKKHSILAKEIASKALTVIKKEEIPSLHQKNVCVLAPHFLRRNMEETKLLNIGKTTDAFFFKDLNPSSREIEAAQMHAKSADVLLVCSYNAWKNPSQEALIQTLSTLGKPVILLVTRDPLDADLFPKADCILSTYSPTTVSLQAASDYLVKINRPVS